MNWYNGGIAEAISMSKTKGAIFVVYIEGKDEASSQITQTIDKPEVAESLGSNSFVAIKIEAGSVPHQQFSQIYKQTPIPSIYFIGKQGTPLDIVKDAADSKTLLDKINTVIRKSGLTVNDSRGAAAQQSHNLLQSERQEPASVPPNVVCEDGVCTIQKPPSAPADATEVKEVSSEEKVERAKQLIEKKRQEKQQEEEEKERQREIERRKMGQNVQQMKRWQDDQELKNIMEERQKEKRENQAARDRVLAQIAQDKAERAARFSSSPPTQPAAAQPSTSSQTSAPPPPRPAARTDVARLQFKLPDGSSATNDFASGETLRAVHAYIKTNLNLSYSYTLSTSFPRRQFTDEDCDSTLLNLELVPSAVILILPISSHGAVSTNPSGGISAMFWYILTPFMDILGYLKTFLFGTGRAPNSTPPPPTANKRNADGPSDSSRLQQPKRSRGPGGETTVVRRQGNIHRLSDKTDSDDENNTWNGNSTQQM